jgi:hypothetical protein
MQDATEEISSAALSDFAEIARHARQIRDQILLQHFRLRCTRSLVLRQNPESSLRELLESLTVRNQDRLLALLDQEANPARRSTSV